ncbi:MAG: glycoside hydrolase family 88 protein [Reichenbachiella sp.]
MNKILILLVITIQVACSGKKDVQVSSNSTAISYDGLNEAISARIPYLIKYEVDSTKFPRSMKKDGTVRGVPSRDWTSGFFPGILFQLYQITADEELFKKGIEWTAFVEKEQYNAGTHDMGFKIFCSVGEAFRITKDPKYKEVIITSAKTLSTRFDPKIGSIRSWDFGKDRWQFPVIIDNMMNLELLFEATKMTNDSSYYKIAETHARTTLKNHFREDNSSYHVVDYNEETGDVLQRVTHQGINDSSVWSRGQAWGLYGFTMAYRYTQIQDFLNQAINIAEFIKNQPLWPADDIPYWDMRDPGIPDAPRDASAAAITASACLELYEYTDNKEYLDFARSIINSLSSSDYVLNTKVSAPFIMDHSTGDWSKQMELDAPIGYADYYFLEAIKRNKKLEYK